MHFSDLSISQVKLSYALRSSRVGSGLVAHEDNGTGLVQRAGHDGSYLNFNKLVRVRVITEPSSEYSVHA